MDTPNQISDASHFDAIVGGEWARRLTCEHSLSLDPPMGMVVIG
jgi:hypothetical protein